MFSFCLHFIYEKSSFESKPVCCLKSKICCRKGDQCINDTIKGKELLWRPPGPSLTRDGEECLRASAGGSTENISCWKGRPRAVCLCAMPFFRNKLKTAAFLSASNSETFCKNCRPRETDAWNSRLSPPPLLC